MISHFTRLFHDDRVDYYGGVSVGADISVEELSRRFHCVVLCTGMQEPRLLGLKNEEQAVTTSSALFGAYNTHPSFYNKNYDFKNIRDVVIIGHGNVALDAARVLLKHPELLYYTDINESFQRRLEESSLKRIHLLGRKGPCEVCQVVLFRAPSQ